MEAAEIVLLLYGQGGHVCRLRDFSRRGLQSEDVGGFLAREVGAVGLQGEEVGVGALGLYEGGVVGCKSDGLLFLLERGEGGGGCGWRGGDSGGDNSGDCYGDGGGQGGGGGEGEKEESYEGGDEHFGIVEYER